MCTVVNLWNQSVSKTDILKLHVTIDRSSYLAKSDLWVTIKKLGTHVIQCTKIGSWCSFAKHTFEYTEVLLISGQDVLSDFRDLTPRFWGECWWWSRGWGETAFVYWGHQRAYCLSPRWFYGHGGPLWNNTDRENSWFVYQSSLAILPAVI
jgi:hypothetical protein